MTETKFHSEGDSLCFPVLNLHIKITAEGERYERRVTKNYGHLCVIVLQLDLRRRGGAPQGTLGLTNRVAC